ETLAPIVRHVLYLEVPSSGLTPQRCGCLPVRRVRGQWRLEHGRLTCSHVSTLRGGTQVRPERDACGIGFVTDREGRASRDIVQTALTALACMTHRGAVAADALTADGSGLLAGIPGSIFGHGPSGAPHGVASLFVRGDDPRAAVEVAAAEEGIAVVDWRTPPTDEDHLGELARASRPEFLQAVLEAPQPDERAAYRLRRRIQATTSGTYVASCSFRTVAYKG